MERYEWISVEDRLPKMRGNLMDIVLCCNEQGHIFEASYDEKEGKWVSIFDYEGSVIWWQPIVLPPDARFI